MDDSVPCCFNCQAKLVLDESVYEKDDYQCKRLSLDQGAQSLWMHDGALGTSGNLYDIICSSSSALKGPMCEDCTKHLLNGMDEHLKELDFECAQYYKLLVTLKEDKVSRLADKMTLNSKLNAMKAEEKALIAELKKLEAEERKLETELKDKKNELVVVETECEEALWKTFRDNHRRLVELEAERQNYETELFCARTQLEGLSKINVLNTAFHIWQQGSFGTINGFRLGRMPHTQIEWNEINAAWGQIALLINAIAIYLPEFSFAHYKVIPKGSYSFVRCLVNEVEYPLFGSGGFKPFGQKKFDEGICAFMTCFCQLQKHIEGMNQFRLPHRMHRDRIEDNKVEYSVKMQFNSEERWTKAMKCLLTNLRWTISFVVMRSSVVQKATH